MLTDNEAIQALFVTLVRLSYRCCACGAENVQNVLAQGTALIIANHASVFDPLLIFATLRRSALCFMNSRDVALAAATFEGV